MTEFYIGQILDNPYPPEAAIWCNQNNCMLDDINVNGEIKTIINQVPDLTEKERKTIFLNTFFKVGDYGYYRKKPKGYQSAIESINTAYNIAKEEGGLPADILIFYPKPNFKKAEQCTEEWLIEHQIKMPAMDFATFYPIYKELVNTWNEENH